MRIPEYLKNPAKVLWDTIDKYSGKKVTKEVSTAQENQELSFEQASITSKNKIKSDFLGFIKALSDKDYKWLFRGKSGTFLKISIPLILVLLLVNSLLSKPQKVVTKDPPVVDKGDLLEKPDFLRVDYLSGVDNNGTYLLYSKKLESLKEFGVRGIALNDFPTNPNYSYYFPLNKDEYLYLEGTVLKLTYLKTVIEEKFGKKIEVTTSEVAVLVEGVNDYKDLIDIQKTSEGFIAFTFNNIFYVFNEDGLLLKEFAITNSFSSLYSYFDGEIYYVLDPVSVTLTETSSSTSASGPSVMNEYVLVKLNRNGQEIYRQDLGSFKVQRIYILNSDRFLILYQQPSTESFFFVQMRDSENRTVFGFTPEEKEQKLVKVDHLYFTPENSTVLMVGGGVGKLFTVSGKQLWIN